MNRMCRMRTGLAIAGVLIGVACRSPKGPVEPPSGPPVPQAPKPGRSCNSRFALAAAVGSVCENKGSKWRIVPRGEVAGRANKSRRYKPGEPWQATSASPGFCVYEWTGAESLHPGDFAQIGATQECAIAVGMAATV